MGRKYLTKAGKPSKVAPVGGSRVDGMMKDSFTSVEVKRYQVINWRNLVTDTTSQAKERVRNLPKGSVQKIKVDITNEKFDNVLQNRIRSEMVQKTEGVLQPQNIEFFKRSALTLVKPEVCQLARAKHLHTVTTALDRNTEKGDNK